MIQVNKLIFRVVCSLILVASTSGETHGQNKNLVLNPGFERFVKCPVSHIQSESSRILVPDWTYPTNGSPDYFNRCSVGDAGVPTNFAGTSEPYQGDGYVGAILSGTDDEYREYIQGRLAKPLEKGQKYCVSYWVKLASGSRFTVDMVSLAFYNTQQKSDINRAFGGIPQMNNLPGLFLDNTQEWKQMCMVYTANGGEQFFIIGNFRNYQTTNYVVTNKNTKNARNKAYAYYYFDEVVIRPLENCTDCPCVNQSLVVALKDTSYTGGKNPFTGRVTKIVNDGKISIDVSGGTPPYFIEWSNKSKDTQLTNLPAGRYTYRVKDQFNCSATGTITFVEPKLPEDEFLAGLKNIEEGSSIVLENIFFEFNKTTLLPASFPELDKVVSFMKEANVSLIEISGHTDSDGSEEYNRKLSDGRAKAVVDYLVAQGIDLTHLQSVGYGESRPIDTNTTDSGKAQNRRVEFALIRK
jgi:outer membrane protein OmpA-like peptidoglycan-associated protein